MHFSRFTRQHSDRAGLSRAARQSRPVAAVVLLLQLLTEFAGLPWQFVASQQPPEETCAGKMHCEFVQSSATASIYGQRQRYVCAYAQNTGSSTLFGETVAGDTTGYTMCSLLVPDSCGRRNSRNQPILTMEFDDSVKRYEFVHCGAGSAEKLEAELATQESALETPMFLLPGGVRSANGPAAWWKAVLERIDCTTACAGLRPSFLGADGCFDRAASPPPAPPPCSVDPAEVNRPECIGEDVRWRLQPNAADLSYVGDVCGGLECGAELGRLRGAFEMCI